MHLSLSPETHSRVRAMPNANNNDLVVQSIRAKFGQPHRSKSSEEMVVAMRELFAPNSPTKGGNGSPRRSLSMPQITLAGSLFQMNKTKKVHHTKKKNAATTPTSRHPEQEGNDQEEQLPVPSTVVCVTEKMEDTSDISAFPPPPLCRWSSSPPCEVSLASPVGMAPTRAHSMRNLRILPPRYPTRRSGKAEELRSALPPTVPLRKPGDATYDSNSMPPFMPQRKLDDSFSSLCGYYGDTHATCRLSLLSSFSSTEESPCSSPSPSSSTSTASRERTAETMRDNLRNILGDVLEQLESEDEDEDF